MTKKRQSASSRALKDLLSEAERALLEGAPEVAESYCKDVLEASPEQAQALFLLAEALRLQGRYSEAELHYKRCVLSRGSQVRFQVMYRTDLDRMECRCGTL